MCIRDRAEKNKLNPIKRGRRVGNKVHSKRKTSIKIIITNSTDTFRNDIELGSWENVKLEAQFITNLTNRNIKIFTQISGEKSGITIVITKQE